jgi:hypothetical protein
MPITPKTGSLFHADLQIARAALSNDHWVVRAFGRYIGSKGTVEGLMAALDAAEKEGRLIYEEHKGGRTPRPAGYVISPDGMTEEKSKVEQEIF